LPAFTRFATSQFDAYAGELLYSYRDESAFKRALEEEVAASIIEGILPDKGLGRVLENWSVDCNVPVEQEMGSEILCECAPDGTTRPARPEILAAHAPHGDFERFTPASVRFSLRFAERGRVREEFRQVLERQMFYWLDQFASLPKISTNPNITIAKASNSEPLGIS
jgi:hypothetical protein